MTGRLIFVRHGQTPANIHYELDTAPPGKPLTPLGQQQAAMAGIHLVDAITSQGSPARLVNVTCSRALRARQTAEIAIGSYEAAIGVPPETFPVHEVDGLTEFSAGDYEGKSDKESFDAYLTVFRAILHGDLNAGLPGGETGEQFLSRYRAVIDGLVAKHLSPDSPHGGDSDVVIVAHGCAIRAFTALASGVEPTYVVDNFLDNAMMSILVPEGKPFGQWGLAHWAGIDR